jgi:transmembrane protein 231
MESIAYIEYKSPNPGKGLRVIGELKLHQKEPLLYRGSDFRFNENLMNSQEFSQEFSQELTLENMMNSYVRRNRKFKIFIMRKKCQLDLIELQYRLV